MAGAIGFSVNGTDMSTLGVSLVDPSGVWDSIFRRYETALRSGGSTSVILAPRVLADPRPLTLRAHITAPDLATMSNRLDQALYVLSADEMVLTVDDRPTRQITVRNEGRVQVSPVGDGASVRFVRELRIPFSAPDPRWYDTTVSQSIALSTSPAACPQGTALVEPVVSGLPGTCEIALLDSGGTQVSVDGIDLKLGFSGIASTPVTVDFANQTIVDSGGTGQMDKLDAGAVFFSLSPRYGDFLTSAWPQLVLSAGSGQADYARAWEG